MAVKETEFKSIIEYIQNKLDIQDINMDIKTDWLREAISILAADGYQDWQKSYKPTRTKRTVATGQYGEQWERLWQLWPSLRTFEYNGRKFICNKPFKTNEALCRQKWEKAIREGEDPEVIYNAAAVALAHCMDNSYRKGRNEMEFASGLLPWINQQQWKNWKGVEMPNKQLTAQMETEI